MKKNLLVSLFVGIIVVIVVYISYPQYSENEITYAEGVLVDVAFVPQGRGGLWTLKLDNGTLCYVPNDDMGDTLESCLGDHVRLGYVNKVRRSAYYTVHLSVGNSVFINVSDVNKSNLWGCIFAGLLVLFWSFLLNLDYFLKLIKKQQEARRKKERRQIKMQKKEKWKKRQQELLMNGECVQHQKRE